MKKLLILVLIAILVISSGCILKNNVGNNSSGHNVTNITNKDPIMWTIGTCQYNPPTDRTIIVRIDDIQGWWNESVIHLINASLERNISTTLAVMPFYWPDGIENDTVLKDYLVDKIKDPRIEIAQHGAYHSEDEYKLLNESETYNVTKLGLEKIVQSLKMETSPITFIPPYNEYNENTTKMLSKLGFKILSAKKDEYTSDGNMLRIGYNVQVGYGEEEDLAPIEDVIRICEASLDEKNLCVVMVHPQDYAKIDSRELDMNRFQEFTKLLDRLKTLNVKFSTFKDLLSCNGTESVDNNDTK